MIRLPKSVARLSDLCAAGSSGRMASLGGIHFIATGHGYRLCATDGHVLGIVSGPVIPPGGEACVVIPKIGWQEAFKLVGKNGSVTVDAEAQLLRVDNHCQIGFQPVDGRFPDYMGILPRTLPLFRFKVNPLLLAEVLRVAASVCEGGETPGVEFLFYKPGGPIGLIGRGKDEVAFDAVVMPLH